MNWRTSTRSTAFQLLCCVVFVCFLVAFWMLPIVMEGFPFELSDALIHVQSLRNTGSFAAPSMRLFVHYLSIWDLDLTQDQLIAWTIINTLPLGAATVMLWLLVRRVWNAWLAWITICVFGLMPIYWLQALQMNGYGLALFFVFFALLVFYELHSRNEIAGFVVGGFLFGCAIASRDAFITFVPWIVLVALWMYRTRTVKAGLYVGLLLLSVGIGFMSPEVPSSLRQKSISGAISELATSFDRGEPGIGHLYPDMYTYEYDRENFEAAVEKQVEDSSFIERRHDENYRLIFGVQKRTVWKTMTTGMWLFLNQLPSLFMMDSIGGALMILFVCIGFISIWQENRRYIFIFGGLVISMELLLRFYFLFARSHLMNIGWLIAILIGVGIIVCGQMLHSRFPRTSQNVFTGLVTLLVVFQLVQANRKQFARLYTSSNVPEAFAASTVIQALPEDAVIAHPLREEFFFLSDRTKVSIHDQTIDRLYSRGELSEPFQLYNVTHIIGYNEERTNQILRSVPKITPVLFLKEYKPATVVSPFVEYLLHVIR